MAEVLEALEVEARARAQHLEAGQKLPAGFSEAYYPLTSAETRQLRRTWACWRLASDLDSCRALLQGQQVPRHRLDPDALSLLDSWPG